MFFILSFLLLFLIFFYLPLSIAISFSLSYPFACPFSFYSFSPSSGFSSLSSSSRSTSYSFFLVFLFLHCSSFPYSSPSSCYSVLFSVLLFTPSHPFLWPSIREEESGRDSWPFILVGNKKLDTTTPSSFSPFLLLVRKYSLFINLIPPHPDQAEKRNLLHLS